jgi:FixJ family two-component response regulator
LAQSSPIIAVVDDEEAVRRALRRLLSAAGFAVEVFLSGEDFLASVASRVPGCLVLDLHMPAPDGFAVQTRLVQSGIRVPVVVITGHDMPGTRERVLALGASAYLRKPVDGQLLLDAIKTAMEGA